MEETSQVEATAVARLEQRMEELEAEFAKSKAAHEEGEEDEEAVKHGPVEFSDMFDALRKSGAVKGIVMSPPTTFTGQEMKSDPFALHRWYKETSCWVKARVSRDIPQAAMALQTLRGTARLAMENIESTTPGKLRSLDAIFTELLNIFQKCDPGPRAYDEFLRTRMRQDESAVEFLNRLLSLSVVINSSKDPTVPTLAESDLSARFRAGLPAWMLHLLREKHQMLVTLHHTPDTSPWGMVATVMDIEQNHPRTSSGPQNRQQQRGGRVNAVYNSNPAGQEKDRPQRAAKRFHDLEMTDQKLIQSLQEEIKHYEFKAKLPAELLQRCRQLSVCESCHRYGHSGRACKARAVFSPKN